MVVSTTDSLFAVNDVFEIVSRDSAYVIRPFIPDEAEISGFVYSDQQVPFPDVEIRIHKNGELYGMAKTGSDGSWPAVLMADGALYAFMARANQYLSVILIPLPTPDIRHLPVFCSHHRAWNTAWILCCTRENPFRFQEIDRTASLPITPSVHRSDTLSTPLYYYDEVIGDWILTDEFG